MPASAARGPVRLVREMLWSLTWSLGVGIGVALGGWLTVAGGSGSPGVSSLSVGHDLFVVPLLSSLAVFFVLVVTRALVGMLRSRGSSRP